MPGLKTGPTFSFPSAFAASPLRRDTPSRAANRLLASPKLTVR